MRREAMLELLDQGRRGELPPIDKPDKEPPVDSRPEPGAGKDDELAALLLLASAG
jgi:hypothetical protein